MNKKTIVAIVVHPPNIQPPGIQPPGIQPPGRLVVVCLLVSTLLILGVLETRLLDGCLLDFPLLAHRASAAEQVHSHAPDGQDWPRFLGPRGDGKSNERGLLTRWPANGPRQLWSMPLGESYGIGSVSNGRYFQFDYQNDRPTLVCVHAESGEPVWDFSYSSDYQDLYGYSPGPRCSPLIDEGLVYVYGVDGIVHCLREADGKLVWKSDLSRTFGVVQNFFGVGSNPVVFKDLLLVMVGGSPPADQAVPPGQLDRVRPNGTGLVALDKRTGQLRYKTGDFLASYAGLQLANSQGRPWCFAFGREGLTALDPRSGVVDFVFPWRAKILESVNASTPVVVDDQVFISETYGPGSAMLRFRLAGYEVVWSDQRRGREKSMQTHWNTPIYHEGYLYGSSGRHSFQAELRCIEWKTGRVMWSEPNLTRSSLLYVDGHFVCLSEDGTLRLIKANPNQYELVAQARPLVDVRAARDKAPANDKGRAALRYPAWAAPILSHGRLYVRGADRVTCFQLTDPKPGRSAGNP